MQRDQNTLSFPSANDDRNTLIFTQFTQTKPGVMASGYNINNGIFAIYKHKIVMKYYVNSLFLSQNPIFCQYLPRLYLVLFLSLVPYREGHRRPQGKRTVKGTNYGPIKHLWSQKFIVITFIQNYKGPGAIIGSNNSTNCKFIRLTCHFALGCGVN